MVEQTLVRLKTTCVISEFLWVGIMAQLSWVPLALGVSKATFRMSARAQSSQGSAGEGSTSKLTPMIVGRI